jgi:dephospho-CoA kinase
MSSQKKIVLPKFIAITGLQASGKDSFGNHLAEYGYLHVAAGDVLRQKARAEGYSDLTRSVLSVVGDELRKEFGPSPITASSIARYQKVNSKYPKGLVISGLRRIGEVKAFKESGAIVLWIDAEDKRRIENEFARARDDQQTPEEFLERSRKEYLGETEGGTDGVNLRAVEAMADCRVLNNGSCEDLYRNGDKVLATFIK